MPLITVSECGVCSIVQYEAVCFDDEGLARISFVQPDVHLMPPGIGALDVVGLAVWSGGPGLTPLREADLRACFVGCEFRPPVLELDLRCPGARRLGNPLFADVDDSVTPVFCFIGSPDEPGRALPHGTCLGRSYQQFANARPMLTYEWDALMYPYLWLVVDPARAHTWVDVAWQVFYRPRPAYEYHRVQYPLLPLLPLGIGVYDLSDGPLPKKAYVTHAVLRAAVDGDYTATATAPAQPLPPTWIADHKVTLEDRMSSSGVSTLGRAGASSMTLVDAQSTGVGITVQSFLRLRLVRPLITPAVLDVVYRSIVE
jgi:hypothetical protein